MSRVSGPVREKAVPAQLRFLAIYNPSLGLTDETRPDQIVYYYNGTRTPTPKSGKDISGELKTEENKRLRHIGLAQGMVEFGKAFSQGKSVDAIETEKSRILLHELEAGWWILASIDLTRLPKVPKTIDSKDKAVDEGNIEYSSREVKPPVLLLQDLLRAHAIFLLHNTSSISSLFAATQKPKFISILGRYWDEFLSTWNVMLHGNPAMAVYNGIKVASSGELGVGVGEEDRGSGEREVLEGFVGRIDGLVDLIVSRFGAVSAGTDIPKVANQHKPQPHSAPSEPWLGTGSEPGPNDGAIFLGVGSLSRKSLRDVTHWMEDVYSWGPRAYGVKSNPPRTRRRHRRGRLPTKAPNSASAYIHSTEARKAGPRSSATSKSLVIPNDDEENGSLSTKQRISPKLNELENKTSLEIMEPCAAIETESMGDWSHSSSRRTPSPSSTQSNKAGALVDYLKLGYGTRWSLGGGTTRPRDVSTSSGKEPETIASGGESISVDLGSQAAKTETLQARSDSSYYPADDSTGHYLVGLVGDVDAEDPDNSGSDNLGADVANPRIFLRTITVELNQESDTSLDTNSGINSNTDGQQVGETKNGSLPYLNASSASPSGDSRDRGKKDLHVVVYANKPFLFTFLFEASTASLTESSVYRSLHYQLAPLQQTLLTSTNHKLPRPNLSTTLVGGAKTPIYDLMWDPRQLTIFSTIPDIPSHSRPSRSSSVWSRLEALNAHMQILNTFAATRNESSELEQTCKTTRGYWVVWTRIPDLEVAQDQISKSEGMDTPVEDDPTIEISPSPSSGYIPERRTGTNYSISRPGYKSDAVMDKEIFLVRKSSDPASANAFARESANSLAKLAQGIGVDTKRYTEGLLDMYR